MGTRKQPLFWAVRKARHKIFCELHVVMTHRVKLYMFTRVEGFEQRLAGRENAAPAEETFRIRVVEADGETLLLARRQLS